MNPALAEKQARVEGAQAAIKALVATGSFVGKQSGVVTILRNLGMNPVPAHQWADQNVPNEATTLAYLGESIYQARKHEADANDDYETYEHEAEAVLKWHRQMVKADLEETGGRV